MSNMQLIESGIQTAQELMERDAHLLDQQQFQPHLSLHHYEWKHPSATYGHFLKPEELLDFTVAETYGLELARRPTGGGIIFHVFDLAFSVHIPSSHPKLTLRTLDNYALINRPIGRAIALFLGIQTHLPILLPYEPKPLEENCRHFCMAKPTCFDVMLEGKKVCGAAQRRTRFGLLHQGSIALTGPDPKLLGQLLKTDPRVLQAMQQHTYPLLSQYPLPAPDLQKARQTLRNLISQELQKEVA